jgi:NADPH:quinone reductase-like Zn-dependent oxidoreductase
VMAHLASGRLQPVVDSVHAPEEAAGAFERLEGAAQFGKIVIDWRA